MKRLIVFFCLSLFSNFNAQLSMQFYKVDCLKSSYTMNFAITLASPGGNFKEAKEFLKNDYFAKNQKESLLIQSLLIQNTLGKAKAIALINDSFKSIEENDYAKLWLAYYTNDIPSFESLLKVFQNKYPENHQPNKLIFRQLIDTKLKRLLFATSDEIEILNSIDSLLNLNTLNNQERLYFSLLKLDVSKLLYRYMSDYDESRNLLELSKLYRGNKSLFHLERLILEFQNNDSTDYSEIIAEINLDIGEANPVSSSNKTIEYFFNVNQNKISVTEAEAGIKQILLTEKNSNELSKIRALIHLFSLKNEPNLGFLMKGVIKYIPFSKTFTQQNLATIKDKQIVLNNIKTLLEEPDFKAMNLDPTSTSLHKDFETLQNLSVEDVHAIYGLLVFTSFYSKSLQKITQSLGSSYTNPSKEDFKNTESYLSFLEKKPLYFNSSRYFYQYLQLSTDSEIFSFFDKFEGLRKKLPGSAAILYNGMNCLKLNSENVEKSNLQNFYISYFKLVVDFLSIPSVIKPDETESLFQTIYVSEEEEYGAILFSDFWGVLSKKSSNEMIKYLKTKIKFLPNNERLQTLERIIQQM